MLKQTSKGVSSLSIIILVLVILIMGFAVWQYLRKEEPKQEEPEQSISDDLTKEEIMNAEYYVYAYEQTVRLKDGYYEEKEPGMMSGLIVEVPEDMIAFGDLDNDGKNDAVLIIFSTGGGSGGFIELVVVINKNGKPFHLVSEYLGDRVIIHSLSIESGIIFLDIVVHGPDDPLCCPSFEKTIKYRLSENQLIEI